MDIQWIKRCVKSGGYEFSSHADIERQVDKVSIDDVGIALINGEILEDYPDDPRGECFEKV